MAQPTRQPSGSDQRSEARVSRDGRSGGIPGAVLGFLRAGGKWWLAPLIVCLMLLGLAFLLGGSAAGPFIYSVF
jgi:hypothetical protein